MRGSINAEARAETLSAARRYSEPSPFGKPCEEILTARRRHFTGKRGYFRLSGRPVEQGMEKEMLKVLKELLGLHYPFGYRLLNFLQRYCTNPN